MEDEKVVACFHEIRETVEDMTDEIFILFYICDHCKELSIDDILGFHRIGSKCGLELHFTASELFFAKVRSTYFHMLRTHTTPKQIEKMKVIIDKHLS